MFLDGHQERKVLAIAGHVESPRAQNGHLSQYPQHLRLAHQDMSANGGVVAGDAFLLVW